jgi:hypothetical protein
MRRIFRYGVFEVGQVWRVVCDGQPEQGFPDRERALAAIDVVREAHRLAGDDCEVFLLDGSSRLVAMTAEAG